MQPLSLMFSPISRMFFTYHLTSVCLLIIIIASIWFCWYYWKLMQAYEKFPSYRLEVNWILKKMLGMYPKNVVPFSSAVFQELTKQCRRHEKEGLCVLWFFYPYLIIYNEEFYKRFFNEPAVADKTILYSLAGDLLGNGLITSNEKIWKSHRKLLNPVFYLGVLKGKLSIFNENAADLVEKLREVANKPTTELPDFLKSHSFNIMAESILGLKLNDEKYGSKIEKYIEAFEELCQSLVYRVARPWLYWKATMTLFSEGRKYLKLCGELRNFTQEILLEMKNSVMASSMQEEDVDCNAENKKSFARILLEQHLKDPTFTLKDVQDHVTTIMAAGHDTTSRSLMWCLYMLGQHPEVQEKAFGETDIIKGKVVTYDDLCELKYLECVIKETLRLYSVAPFYGRKLSKEVQCGGYTIPKGTDIAFFVYLMHRNPNIYVDPDTFNPERFSENSDIRPWMFMPFADGYRSCIGKKFAMMEMKVILVHILRRFQIRTLDKIEETDLDWIFVLGTNKPVRLLFTPRQTRSLTYRG